MQSATPHPLATTWRQIPLWMIRTAAVMVTVGLLALSIPLILGAVSAGLGLLALAAIGAVGVALFQALPWGMQALENRLLKLRKSEARANPIEQLENEVRRRAARLKAFRCALATVGGQIESIRQMMADRLHRDPEHALAQQGRALERLEQFHGANLGRLDQAQAALEEFSFTVERKKSEWTIAVAINNTLGLLDPQACGHLIDDLLTDTALRTVQDRFNTVFAELDIQLHSVDAPTRALVGRNGQERLDPLILPQSAAVRSTP